MRAVYENKNKAFTRHTLYVFSCIKLNIDYVLIASVTSLTSILPHII